jgi:hypothetical protein
MSQRSASAWPPAASTSAAAVWMVPGSFGLGPWTSRRSRRWRHRRAARRAIASPIPREAPVMKSVLPASVVMPLPKSRRERLPHSAPYNRSMPTHWLDTTVAWITANPRAAGLLILLIAFCDALAVVGIIVPAMPLLFAVGTLVGLGHIDGTYAIVCASVGAFAGDALSFWIGHRWGPQMRGLWLFRRYPQLLDRGERVFRRHGSSRAS